MRRHTRPRGGSALAGENVAAGRRVIAGA